MKAFTSPGKTLGTLDTETAATLIAAASDVALVIDEAGVIRDVAFHSESLARDLPDHARWIGRLWVDTVTVESRPKAEALLSGSRAKGAQRWRHLNYPAPRGPDLPVLYSTVKVGKEGRTVAFGRDLRPLSELQRRLVDAQQSLERDYSRMRHVEIRYRLLFQMSSDAVLILDAATLKVVEANPAAYQLFGEAAKRVIGRMLPSAFEPASRPIVQNLLAAIRSTGHAPGIRARLLPGGKGQEEATRDVVVTASVFREDTAALFLVRLAPEAGEQAQTVLSDSRSKLLKLVESAPDGCVVVDRDGLIVAANAAFRDLIQVASEAQIAREPLDRWLGRTQVDADVLIANLRQHGSIRLFASVVRGQNGIEAPVEISGVALQNGGQPCYGLAIRHVGNRAGTDNALARDLPRSAEHLAELIGRVSLKELVREATDVIERLCIETALEMTGNNRASAAGMLGLSRQSFYAKLHRHGLGNLAAESGN